MTITAAVDGSALGNPGPAGWAWVVSADAWAAGGFKRATNNVGELTALLRLLEDTARAGFGDEPLQVLADSQYVINSVTKWMPGWKRRGWKKADGKPVQNREILEQIDRAMAGRSVRFEWVKGHAGHDLNEAADLRARAAAEANRDGRPTPEGPGFTQTMASRTARPTSRPGVDARREQTRRSPGRTGSSTGARAGSGDQGPGDSPIVAISATEAISRWEEVLSSASVEPVTITRSGEPSLLLMDADTAWKALALLDNVGEESDGMLF